MSPQILLLSACACAVIRAASCDDPGSPSLAITPEPGDVIAARTGDVVEYTCTLYDENFGYQYLLYWFQTKGNIDYQLVYKYDDAATLRMQLKEADNGTVLFCKAFKLDDKYLPFLNSKAMTVKVSSSAPTLDVTLAPGDAQSDLQSEYIYNVGEEIEFNCRAPTEVMPESSPLAWQQVKGSSDTTLVYSSKNKENNVTEITLKTKLTIADDNTKLYCWLWAWSSSESKYMIVRSDYKTIRVRKSIF